MLKTNIKIIKGNNLKAHFLTPTLLFSFITPQSFAADVSSQPVEIKSMNFYSKQETIYPSHKGLLQVRTAQEISWSANSDCHSYSILVRNEDTHMISALITARATSTPIRLYADDTKRINTECYIRALGY